LNLYGFVGNDGVNRVDYFGLITAEDIKRAQKELKDLKDKVDDMSELADVIDLTIKAANGDYDSQAQLLLHGIDKALDAVLKRAGAHGFLAMVLKETIKDVGHFGVYATDWFNKHLDFIECQQRIKTVGFYIIGGGKIPESQIFDLPRSEYRGNAGEKGFKIIKKGCSVWVNCRSQMEDRHFWIGPKKEIWYWANVK